MNIEIASEVVDSEPTALADRIRQRAYLLWEGEGRQEGRADKYWHRAREVIEDEAQSAFPPAQSRGNRD